MTLKHEAIALCFRKNAGRGNGLESCISLYLTLVRNSWKGLKSIAIYQQMIWSRL
jgi:hypothetical protein